MVLQKLSQILGFSLKLGTGCIDMASSYFLGKRLLTKWAALSS